MFTVTPMDLEIVLRLCLATGLGYIIGLERRITGHPAGERTNALAALGACLYTVLSLRISGADPSRIAANVVVGLGFLGAGMILQNPSGAIHGLTTAAGIWTVGAVGLAIGAGEYLIGMTAAGLTLIILISEKILRLDERIVERQKRKKKPPIEPK